MEYESEVKQMRGCKSFYSSDFIFETCFKVIASGLLTGRALYLAYYWFQSFGIWNIASVRFDLITSDSKVNKVNLPTEERSGLIIDPRGLECENNLKEIMDCKSFGAVGFDICRSMQRSNNVTKLKSPCISLSIYHRGL